MWVIVENLRYYLNSDEIYLAQTGGRPEGLPRGLQIPLYLGEPVVMNGKGPIYNTGGPGKFVCMRFQRISQKRTQ